MRVEDAEAAERERFLGSPTAASTAKTSTRRPPTTPASACRLFATPEGLRGMPADAWVLAALQRAQTA